MSEADIDELSLLLAKAKRPYVSRCLQREIDSLSKQIETEKAAVVNKVEEEVKAKIEVAPAAPAAPTAITPPPVPASNAWISVDKFAFDPGEYNSKSLSIYVELKDVVALKQIEGAISCEFTKGSFDLKVVGLEGKNYRLFKDNLSHPIDVPKCKYIVKKDKIVVKLAKVKGEFSYDSWTELTSSSKKKQSSAKADPSAGIMDMMKNMYDEGDDKMKQVIGEAMLKSRSGEKMDAEPPMPEFDKM
ncbi:hypothetical protein TrLO_g5824 [Triparma laevis f. longispina]|uniref:Calcyclin-binding protein n=1 Tax=Triparma laevis f. longispina TaxID=1714387 RepID=A0A9W6ZLN1_9STRA|nr:hypothetical protein TrLO_g5824 [Triparma laevis f. longispina]